MWINSLEWHRRMFCPCGYNVPASDFQSRFHRDGQPCPDCGGEFHNTAPTVLFKVVRWVKTGKWWSPATWGNGVWEEKSNGS